MIECQRTDQIRPTGERDHAEFVVRPLADEFADNLFHHLKPVGRFAGEGEIQRFHRSRDIQGEHDINSAGLDLGGSAATARSGKRDDQQRQRQQSKKRQHATNL